MADVHHHVSEAVRAVLAGSPIEDHPKFDLFCAHAVQEVERYLSRLHDLWWRDFLYFEERETP